MSTQRQARPYEPVYDRSTNEQDRFLEFCLNTKTPLTVFLTTGQAFQGVVVDHDRKLLRLGPKRQDKEPRAIAKSAICYVRADEHLPLFLEYKGLGNHITRRRVKKAQYLDRRYGDI
jgi:sRNA-binding regulator protein Hfq